MTSSSLPSSNGCAYSAAMLSQSSRAKQTRLILFRSYERTRQVPDGQAPLGGDILRTHLPARLPGAQAQAAVGRGSQRRRLLLLCLGGLLAELVDDGVDGRGVRALRR